MNPAADKIQGLLSEAWDYRVRSQFDKANTCLEEARKLCFPEDHLFLGRIAHIDRQIAADQDRWELAAEYGWKAIEYYTIAAVPLRTAHALRHQADIMCHLDCGIEAQTLYEKALKLYKENEYTNLADLANALRGYALNLVDMGQKKQAREAWKDAAHYYAQIGLTDGVEEAKSWLIQLG